MLAVLAVHSLVVFILLLLTADRCMHSVVSAATWYSINADYNCYCTIIVGELVLDQGQWVHTQLTGPERSLEMEAPCGAAGSHVGHRCVYHSVPYS